jgi:hypothetical protein
LSDGTPVARLEGDRLDARQGHRKLPTAKPPRRAGVLRLQTGCELALLKID